MKSRRLLVLFLALLAVLAMPAFSAPRVLRVLTHSSFAATPAVLAAFEKANDAKLEFSAGGDAGETLNKAILSRSSPLADVLYGVDNTFLGRALAADILQPYDSPALASIPAELQSDSSHRMLPVDFGYVCLNYDRAWFAAHALAVPRTLEDLARAPYKGLVVVENPATSSPGLAFLLATIARFGETGAMPWQSYWAALRQNDVMVVSGWDDAYYNQFSEQGKGKRPIVVSYATSPAYELYNSPAPKPAEPPTGNILPEGSAFRQIEYVGDPQGRQGPGPCTTVRRLHALRDIPGRHPPADVGVPDAEGSGGAADLHRFRAHSRRPRVHRAPGNRRQPRRVDQGVEQDRAGVARVMRIAARWGIKVPRGIKARSGFKARRGIAAVSLGAAPVIFLCLFLVYPMARVLAMGAGPVVQAGWAGLRQVSADTGLPRLLAASALQAFLSTALTLVLGLPIAWVFTRFSFPGKSVLRTLLLVPFVLPTIVVGSAFVQLIGSGGLFERVLVLLTGNADANGNLTRSLGAVLLAHAFYNTAIVVRVVGSAWSGLDPRLEQAARTLGAGRWRSFCHVTLRLLAPSIAASCILVFAFCFSSFGIILMLGGPRMGTLETEIYRQAVSMFDLPAAACLAVVQLVLTVLVMFGYARLQSRTSVVRNLRVDGSTKQPPSSAGQWLLVSACGIAPAVGLLLPLAALVLGSFQARSGMTAAWWTALFAGAGHSLFWVSPLRAAANSFFFAVEAAAISLVLGIPAAYLIARGQASKAALGGAGAAALDLLFLVPLGTSAVTLGFGFIVGMSGPPLPLQGNPILIPIAHSLVALPLVIRSLLPALRAINPRLREAAAVLGARPAAVRLRIDLPLLRLSFIAAAAFAFTVSLGEFGATAMLTRPGQVTLPILIFDSLSRPGWSNQGQAMALGTILMAACGAGLAVIERARVRGAEAL